MKSAFCLTLVCFVSVFTTCLCHAAPSIQWFKSFGAEAAMSSGGPVADANSETAYVWIKSGSGTALHRIDDQGVVLWTRPVELPDFDNYSLSVDDSDNVYLSWGGVDWHVQKHNPDGDVAWTRTYDATRADRPYAGTLADSSGNVYVGGVMTGSFHPSQGVWDHDAALGQLDSAGNVLWTRQWGTPDHESVSSMGVDGLGNVILGEPRTPIESPGGLPSETSFRKLSASGDLLWTRQFAGFGRVLSVDNVGNSFVHVRPPGAGTNDNDIAKLSPDGDVLWTRQVDSFGGTTDIHGNLYVTRWSTGELDKYGPDGEYLWTISLTNGAPGNIYSIDVDDVGNIFVSGRTLGPRGVSGPVLDVWLARVIEQVPEPSAASLMLGALALAAISRCRQRSSKIDPSLSL